MSDTTRMVRAGWVEDKVEGCTYSVFVPEWQTHALDPQYYTIDPDEPGKWAWCNPDIVNARTIVVAPWKRPERKLMDGEFWL